MAAPDPTPNPQDGANGVTFGSAIALQGVQVAFPQHPPVLDQFSLQVKRGQFVSVVGPSGCGKSTLLRVVAGLVQPTTGEVAFDEGETSGEHVAFVFQEPALLPWRDVRANIELPLELAGVDRTRRRRAVDASLSLIGLSELDGRKYPAMLSGGMRMRVSLARALVRQPAVLLLDEPFAALDDMLRQQLNEELLGIWRSQQWTTLFVTHNVSEAVYLSQQVVIMRSHPGTVAEIVEVPFAYPRSPQLRLDPEFSQIIGQVSSRLRKVNA